MAHLVNQLMDQVMTEELAKVYIRNWKNIEAFFEKETLEKVLSNFDLRGFATFEDVPVNNTGRYNFCIKQGYICYTPKPVSCYVTEYSNHDGGGWERRVSRLCYSFIVPNQYQLREKELLTMALQQEFPYLKKYITAVYHMDSGCTRPQIEEHIKNSSCCRADNYFGGEIYIKVHPDFGSIYVPFVALKEHNPDIIIQRHTTYHKAYYNGAGREEAKAKSLSVLDTPEAKMLFMHITAGV